MDKDLLVGWRNKIKLLFFCKTHGVKWSLASIIIGGQVKPAVVIKCGGISAFIYEFGGWWMYDIKEDGELFLRAIYTVPYEYNVSEAMYHAADTIKLLFQTKKWKQHKD